MDEDTPDEIADKMNQADYLKEKDKEAFKEQVRQVCLKAKTRIENENTDATKPDNPPLSVSESSTSLNHDPAKDDEFFQVSRVDEISSSEVASQIGSPRTEHGTDISSEQQFESAVASPTGVLRSPEEQVDQIAVNKSYSESGSIHSAAIVTGSQLLQRSPSGSSVTSVGSIGSQPNSNMAARAGQVYSAKESEAILTNSLNNHFASTATSHAGPMPKNSGGSDPKTDKDTSGSEYNTLTSSKTDPLSGTQDSGSLPSGEQLTAAMPPSHSNPITVIPVTPPVLISQTDMLSKDKKRFNPVELDKQLTAILSHPVNSGEGQVADPGIIPFVPVVVPLAVVGGHDNMPPAQTNEVTNPSFADTMQTNPNFTYSYSKAAASEATPGDVVSSGDADQSALAAGSAVPVMLAISSTVAPINPAQPAPFSQSAPVTDLLSPVTESNLVSEVESIPSYSDVQSQPTSEGTAVSEGIKSASDPTSSAAEAIPISDQSCMSSRFQVSKVQEDVMQEYAKVSDSIMKPDSFQSASEISSASKESPDENKNGKEAAAAAQTIGRFQVTPAAQMVTQADVRPADILTAGEKTEKNAEHQSFQSSFTHPTPDVNVSERRAERAFNDFPVLNQHPQVSGQYYVGVSVPYHPLSTQISPEQAKFHEKGFVHPSLPHHIVEHRSSITDSLDAREGIHSINHNVNQDLGKRTRTLSNTSDRSLSSLLGEFTSVRVFFFLSSVLPMRLHTGVANQVTAALLYIYDELGCKL